MKTRKFVRVGSKGKAYVDPAVVTTLYEEDDGSGGINTLVWNGTSNFTIVAEGWDKQRTAATLGIELVDSVEDADLKAAAVAAVDALLDYEQGIATDAQIQARIALSRALWGMVRGEGQ